MSDVQTALITLVSRNILDFADDDFILHTYGHILTIPCPTVRDHAITSFNNLLPLVKRNPLLVSQLVDMFVDAIYLEAPYHCLMTALKFFQIILGKKFGFVPELSKRLELLTKLTDIENHCDNNVQTLARSVSRILTSLEHSSFELDAVVTANSTPVLYNVNELIDDISKIKGKYYFQSLA